MDGQLHKRVSWRKLICVLSAILVVAAPMSGSVCAGRNCAPQNSEAAAPCSGMDMPKHSTPAIHQSPIACCQLTPIPPVAFWQSTDTQESKAELSSGISENMFVGLLATQSMAPRSVNSPPRHDVQSLFSTLLI